MGHSTDWVDACSVIRVEHQRQLGEKQITETVFYISSHEPNAPFIAQAIRSYWQVENKVHWVLDVVYREDDCRIRRGNGVENVAIIRPLWINLARLHPKKDSMHCTLKAAAWNDDVRDELLFEINALNMRLP